MKDRWPGDSPISWYQPLGGVAPAFLLFPGALPANSSVGFVGRGTTISLAHEMKENWS